MRSRRFVCPTLVAGCLLVLLAAPAAADPPHEHHPNPVTGLPAIDFDVQSVRSGAWSDAKTWEPARVPRQGDRVRVTRGTEVLYDVDSKAVLRLVQVVGTLRFARDRNTTLNVGILKVQNNDACSESGFACDFHAVSEAGEPYAPPAGDLPALEIGTPDEPLPRQVTARIRLHYLEGMNKDDAPAVVCCSARMDLHGAPLSRTWVKLGADVEPGAAQVALSEDVEGWQAGDEVIVTGSEHHGSSGRFRYEPQRLHTESRRIKRIEGRTLTLDAPLEHPHFGSGDYRSEVANLSRNVVIESADPDGVRGHTLYHRYSAGSVSYVRFAHLGKENVLGRYALHFHLVENTMRGAQVLGAALVDSHNRWITIHGTNYLVVRDCVGYRSVGHGFFLEDGTEVYNVLDHNLGVQAYAGKRLPKQVLPFDPNDGAAFWWANGRNTLIRNTACENDKYGFRYDSQKRSNFNSNLPVMMPDGEEQRVDIRTLPFYRFESNEAHTEGLYGMVVAGTDGIGPDTHHPHVLKNLKIWQVHYALRSEVPTMLVENVDIDHAAYGIYRPWFENHVYRNLRIAYTGAEPFNRGLDDRSLQHGQISVDGLTFVEGPYGSGMPLIQISADNASGAAESHFRNVKVERGRSRAPLVNLGGGPRRNPKTEKGVPVYIHDYYGPGRDAMVVSTRSAEYRAEPSRYHEEPPLTGDESRVAEVDGVEFPELLDPVDDLPPATVITSPTRCIVARLVDGELVVRGTTTENFITRRVLVNGVEARSTDFNFHQWEARLKGLKAGKLEIEAYAEDAAGNVEQTPHKLVVTVK